MGTNKFHKRQDYLLLFFELAKTGDPRYNVTEAFSPPLATLFAQNDICCFGSSSAVLVVSGGIVVSN